MADFNAGTAVPVVHFNFAPYVDWSGELTEPSFEQINRFRHMVGELIAKASANAPDVDVEQLTVKQRLELMGQMLDVDNSADQETVISAVVGLTGLDHERFLSVPWRVQQEFFGHLVAEYLSPEAQGTPATS